jgi:DNA-directed RNA polymerase specialized sigma24 family protein
MHPTDEPIDSLARDLRDNPGGAAGRVDAEFRTRLVGLADRLLDPRARGAVDAEDVAQSALKSFFTRQAADPLPVDSRAGLWRLLAAIARRKCVKVARRELARKRGGRAREVVPDGSSAGTWDVADPDAVPPDALAVMSDLYRQLLARLDDLHRPVCELWLDGCTADEAAARLGVSPRTVERRLARVRRRLDDLGGGA